MATGLRVSGEYPLRDRKNPPCRMELGELPKKWTHKGIMGGLEFAYIVL